MKLLIAMLLNLLTQIGLPAADLPPSVFVNLKEDWGDADLKVTSVQKKEDGSVVIEAAATFGNEPMGFRVVLLPAWVHWKPKDWPMDSYRGVVRLESMGKPSDLFVRSLAQAYKQKIEQIDFTTVELVAISLGGDPRAVRSEPVKLKLFFESEKEEAYAEAFLNFDLSHSLLQFHEKDHDYRKSVLGFLTRGRKANQLLQPTTTALTPPASQEPRQR